MSKEQLSKNKYIFGIILIILMFFCQIGATICFSLEIKRLYYLAQPVMVGAIIFMNIAFSYLILTTLKDLNNQYKEKEETLISP